MSIKAVTIDFWNTLFDSSAGQIRNNYRHSELIDVMKSLGTPVDDDKIRAAMHTSWEFFNKQWLTVHRTPQPEEIIRYYWQHLEIPYDEGMMDRLLHEFSTAVLKYPPKLIPGVKNAIATLSKKYKLAIVSDTGFSPGTILRELLRRNGLLGSFDAFSFSDETGVSKPHPKAFRAALGFLDVEPEFAVHIGDIEKTDIDGAKNLGMKAVRFVGDPTARFNKDNPADSRADFETDDWSNMVEIIEGLL